MSGFWVMRIAKRWIRRFFLGFLGIAAIFTGGTALSMTLSMLLSLGLYAAAFGFQFAAGFVVLLGLHEMGHWLASRVVGLGVLPPMFIPFVGAVIRLKQAPYNAKMEANIALGGPAMGTLSALLFLTFYFWEGNLLLLILAHTACLLNLFNLIPCDPMDGGRIAPAITARLWWVGSGVIALLFFYTGNFFFLVIFFISLIRLWFHEETEENKYYYRLTGQQRLKVAFWYFGLLCVLGLTALYTRHLLQ